MKRAWIFAGALALLAPAAALPATCDGVCTVGSSAFGYTPAVLVLTSGSSLSWTSSDSTHVTVDGVGNEDASCVAVFHSLYSPSPLVRFDATSGALTAATGTGSPVDCDNAEELPDGSFALPYYCSLHPTMRGALVVQTG